MERGYVIGHEIIADDMLDEAELPALDEIINVFDKVNESTKEMRTWAQKRREQGR